MDPRPSPLAPMSSSEILARVKQEQQEAMPPAPHIATLQDGGNVDQDQDMEGEDGEGGARGGEAVDELMADGPQAAVFGPARPPPVSIRPLSPTNNRNTTSPVASAQPPSVTSPPPPGTAFFGAAPPPGQGGWYPYPYGFHPSQAVPGAQPQQPQSRYLLRPSTPSTPEDEPPSPPANGQQPSTSGAQTVYTPFVPSLLPGQSTPSAAATNTAKPPSVVSPPIAPPAQTRTGAAPGAAPTPAVPQKEDTLPTQAQQRAAAQHAQAAAQLPNLEGHSPAAQQWMLQAYHMRQWQMQQEARQQQQGSKSPQSASPVSALSTPVQWQSRGQQQPSRAQGQQGQAQVPAAKPAQATQAAQAQQTQTQQTQAQTQDKRPPLAVQIPPISQVVPELATHTQAQPQPRPSAQPPRGQPSRRGGRPRKSDLAAAASLPVVTGPIPGIPIRPKTATSAASASASLSPVVVGQGMRPKSARSASGSQVAGVPLVPLAPGQPPSHAPGQGPVFLPFPPFGPLPPGVHPPIPAGPPPPNALPLPPSAHPVPLPPRPPNWAGVAFPPDFTVAKNEETFRRHYMELYSPPDMMTALDSLCNFFGDVRGWYFQSLPWAVALVEQAARAVTFLKQQPPMTTALSTLLQQIQQRLSRLIDILAARSPAWLNPNTPPAEVAASALRYPPVLRVELWRRAEDVRAAWHELNSRFPGGIDRAAVILRDSAKGTFDFTARAFPEDWSAQQNMPLQVSIGKFVEHISRVAQEEEASYYRAAAAHAAQLGGQQPLAPPPLGVQQQQQQQVRMQQIQREIMHAAAQATIQHGQAQTRAAAAVGSSSTPPSAVAGRRSVSGSTSARGSPVVVQSPMAPQSQQQGGKSMSPPGSAQGEIRIPLQGQGFVQGPGRTPSGGTQGQQQAGQVGRPGTLNRNATTSSIAQTQAQSQILTQQLQQVTPGPMPSYAERIAQAVNLQQTLPSQIRLTSEQFARLQALKAAQPQGSQSPVSASTPPGVGATRRHSTDATGLAQRSASGGESVRLMPVVDATGRPEPPLPPSVFRTVSTDSSAGTTPAPVAAAQISQPLQYHFNPPVVVNPSQSPESRVGTGQWPSEEESRHAIAERRKRMDARKNKGKETIDLTTPSPPPVSATVKPEDAQDAEVAVKQEKQDDPAPVRRETTGSTTVATSPVAQNDAESNLLGLHIGPPATAQAPDDTSPTEGPPPQEAPPEVQEEEWSIWNEPLLPVVRAFAATQHPHKNAAEIEEILRDITREQFEPIKAYMEAQGLTQSEALLAEYEQQSRIAPVQGEAAQDAVMEDSTSAALGNMEGPGGDALNLDEGPASGKKRKNKPKAPKGEKKVAKRRKSGGKSPVAGSSDPVEGDTVENDIPKEPLWYPESEQDSDDEDMEIDKPAITNPQPREMSPLSPVPSSELDEDQAMTPVSAAEANGVDNASDSENEQQQVELVVATGSSTAGASEPPDTPPLGASLHSSSATPFPESGPHTERTADGRCKDCLAIMDDDAVVAAHEGAVSKFEMPHPSGERWVSYEWENGPPAPGRAQWKWIFHVSNEEATAARRWAQRFDGFDPSAHHLVFQLGVYDAQEVLELVGSQMDEQGSMDLSGLLCAFPESGMYGILNDGTDHKFGISLFRHEPTQAIDLSASIQEGKNTLNITSSKLWEDKTIILEKRWPSDEEWNKTVEWYHRGEKMLLDHVSALFNLKAHAEMMTNGDTDDGDGSRPKHWWEQYKGKTPMKTG